MIAHTRYRKVNRHYIGQYMHENDLHRRPCLRSIGAHSAIRPTVAGAVLMRCEKLPSLPFRKRRDRIGAVGDEPGWLPNNASAYLLVKNDGICVPSIVKA